MLTEVEQISGGPLDRDRSELGWDRIREEFPVLDQKINNSRLAYLDNAASSQMPEPVLERMMRYRRLHHSNVHRGVHTLSRRATKAHREARNKIARFINAPAPETCVFVRGATEGINLVMQGWGTQFIEKGDEIILSRLEHHSNIVPWQFLRDEVGAHLEVWPMDDDGQIHVSELEDRITERTKLVAVTHVSNALGTVTPIREIIETAHAHDVPVLVDGCQAAPHLEVDVQQLDADFYVFSGHKMFGPTGIGVVYAKKHLLEQMQPFQGGGDMIKKVTFEKTTYNDLPHKFEAGTPAIAQAIGMGAAVDYLESIGMQRIAEREQMLLAEVTEALEALDGVRIYGRADRKASVVSFTVDGVHPHDIGTVLDNEGVAIRAGHHCAQPVMDRLGIPATARASFAFYNTPRDIEALVGAIETVKEFFG